jgi:thiamine-monophosphate kinase
LISEHTLLARLRSIATDPAARGLLDDAAVLNGLVLTHDSIAESVHYLPADPPASVGWKLAAVNLSDLAAKGAKPRGALLSLTIAGDSDGAWEDAFLDGLAEACAAFAMPLIGGDTIVLPRGAPRVLGLTAIGEAGSGVPSRTGGRPGDRLWLIGTLGNGAAGLQQLVADPSACGPLVDAYRRPVPLVAAGQALARCASASMDVSDGLLLDLNRLCAASGCGARIELGNLPLSEAFAEAHSESLSARLFAATGGDDYALLMALPPDFEPFTLSLPEGTKVTAIGSLVPGDTVSLTYEGASIPLPERLGHEHRTANNQEPAHRRGGPA